ncbi:hypothetical protein BLNAU_14889 [Blattamonas nauphoetae]|uniref:Uncharacterized protein n=1 Tax=Blattamonas nauphoetae TaxID=2049346 RepID=A0ABQ9XCH0_9EUKA|nr:hypothetical protein BLNAU_14889 [Blattamonas nauphoetae]
MAINPRVFPKSSGTRYPRRSVNNPTIDPKRELFTNFDPKSELSFEDKSRIYCSLLSLVKAEHPFDDVLQDKAGRFLKSLEPKWHDSQIAAKLVTDLVPSSAGSASGFVTSIVTLLSSPYSRVVEAAMSFMYKTTKASSPTIRTRLMESDLITNVFTSIQPPTLPISGNETLISILIKITNYLAILALPPSLGELAITTASDAFNHREMIFQKVALPSSQFVTFLISNRYLLNEDLFDSFMSLLTTLLGFSPYHHPTLEFVITSPIAMGFSSSLSSIETDNRLHDTLETINNSLRSWKNESPEVVQSGKRVMQALFSEGFEDTLEQKLMNDKRVLYGLRLVRNCQFILKLLGSNASETENDEEE